jgi:hypothetical protein
LTGAEARLEEVMLSGVEVEPTAIEVFTDWLCAGLLLSVTVAVKLKVPEMVGVPEMVPLLARLRPVGKLPEVMVQL